MKFVVDESVSYAVVEKLREFKYEVVSVAKDFASLKDRDVYKLAVAEKAILITRDHHFTNSIRFPPEKQTGLFTSGTETSSPTKKRSLSWNSYKSIYQKA